jgi:hypothetical protein
MCGDIYKFRRKKMFNRVFETANFSYYHEMETDHYRLYWRKYDIDIILKDYDAFLFKKQLEMINSEPEKDVNARIERSIAIHFYFRFACPMPQFSEI